MEYHLGNCKFLTASKFKGKLYVHIRKFDYKDNGMRYATKQGVTMKPERFASFVDKLHDIDRKFKQIEMGEEKQVQIRVGGKLCALASKGFQCINLRYMFRKQGKELVSKYGGISLSPEQWENLIKYSHEMKEKHNELKDVVPCYLRPDHYNQLGMLYCLECTPFLFDEDSNESTSDSVLIISTPPRLPPPETTPLSNVTNAPRKRVRRTLSFEVI